MEKRILCKDVREGGNGVVSGFLFGCLSFGDGAERNCSLTLLSKHNKIKKVYFHHYLQVYETIKIVL